jgi:flagella basal body P-ring formation protein FlgA
VAVERRDALALREPADAAATGDASLEICETVSAGQVVPARAVRPRPVVQRGRLVDALVQDGSLRITMKVEVLNDGLPGQTVRVRNPKTKREFHAQVQNDQTVLLHL